MSYYPKNDAYLYKDEAIVFNVGKEAKESYSVQIRCTINENNEATIKTSVCKNSSCSLKPENPIPNKKYKEENLFYGTFGECVNYIKKNGTTIHQNEVNKGASESGATTAAIYDLAAADYIEAFVFQNGGSTLSFLATVQTNFSVVYLGA